MRVMVAPRKYPEELRERAIRMAVDARRDPVTRTGALQRVGEQLGINAETLRGWVSQAEIDAGDRAGTTPPASGPTGWTAPPAPSGTASPPPGTPPLSGSTNTRQTSLPASPVPWSAGGACS